MLYDWEIIVVLFRPQNKPLGTRTLPIISQAREHGRRKELSAVSVPLVPSSTHPNWPQTRGSMPSTKHPPPPPPIFFWPRIRTRMDHRHPHPLLMPRTPAPTLLAGVRSEAAAALLLDDAQRTEALGQEALGGGGALGGAAAAGGCGDAAVARRRRG